MMEKALFHMTVIDSDFLPEENLDGEDGPVLNMEPNGSYFHIEVTLVNRRRGVVCTQLNRHMKPHSLVPLQMPTPILDYFKKD